MQRAARPSAISPSGPTQLGLDVTGMPSASWWARRGRRQYDRDVPRFEIVLSRTLTRSGAPGERRIVLGRLASILAAALTALVATGVVIVAIVLGYLIAGAIVATILVAFLVALLRGAFVALRH